MKLPHFLLFVGVLFLLMSSSVIFAQTEASAVVLRPTASAVQRHAQSVLGIPFYQAIPFAPGALQPSEALGLRAPDGKPVPALVTTAARWPDGSVRWLRVEGVWPYELDLSPVTRVIIDDTPPAWSAKPRGVVRTLNVKDNEVHLLDENGAAALILSPQASYIEITKPKEILPDSVPDTERQYAWAEPLEALNPGGEIKPLNLRIRDCIVEITNELFTVYRIRGNGGDSSPDSELEWQLRVRIYHVTPVVRLQMSWSLHWDPKSYALTSAKWVARSASPLSEVYISGMESPFNADQSVVRIGSLPSGHSALIYNNSELQTSEWPNEQWHALVAGAQDKYLGVGVVNLTRLGPNHIAVYDDRIEFASWSSTHGYGLDLRPTALPDEFGIDPVDGRSVAVGVTRTLESSLIWTNDPSLAQGLADLEARRETLWLPSREDITKAQALGPWNEGTFFANSAYFDGLHANLRFLFTSREHWRWNGWANFGDVRTNFGSATNPERGLHAERWSLHGRYGWRNGSSSPSNGLWIGGLVLDDRELCLAGLDYALHVADVDVSHASFYGPPRSTDGGMHRRNKDHWSGSVQMQYTPNDYLYLSYWLTGDERLRETLEEIRSYAARQGRSGSVFAAQAWIHRYMETHDPDDLAMAQRLLEESAGAWAGRTDSPDERSGLSILYADNFRLTLDGIPVLIQFYEATGDQDYLEAILQSMQAQGLPERPVPSLAEYHGLAYVLLSGYTEEQIGTDLVVTARRHISQMLYPQNLPPKTEWDYSTLVDIVLQRLQPAAHAAYRESLTIGLRGAMAPIVIHAFGLPPKELALEGPKDIYVGRGGSAEVSLTVKRLYDHEALTGYLHIKNLPDHLRITPDQIAYEIPPGQKQRALQLRFEALPYLAPGVYNLTVEDPERTELSAALSVRLPGWRLVDDFRPPLKDSWFGTFSFEVAEEKSEGWQFATSDIFEDPDRLQRIEATTEYLIYDALGLYDFSLTFYARMRDVEQVAERITFEFRTGNEDWTTLPTKLTWTQCDDEHVEARLSAQEGRFLGDGKLRITVFGGEAEYPQLSYLEIQGWR